jgi:predicted lactoylglutathione lyase
VGTRLDERCPFLRQAVNEHVEEAAKAGAKYENNSQDYGIMHDEIIGALSGIVK